MLTRPGLLDAHLTARLDATEDPEDVYRIYVPPHRTVAVSVKADDEVELALWGSATSSVHEHGGALRRDLLAVRAAAKATTMQVENGGARSQILYLDVSLGAYAATAAYTVTIGVAR